MIKISIMCPSIRPSGLEIVQKCLKEQTFTEFEFLTEIGLGKKYDINQAWNRMARRAQGELLVCYQDFIKIEPDGLQRFWDAYQANPGYCFTGAVGKSQNLEFTEPKWDWRKTRLGQIPADHCEFDWGALPKKALFDIGGFDERLDEWWSFDNVSVCKRAEMLGYKFMCIENPSIAYDHDTHMKNPFRDDYRPMMATMIMEDYVKNPRLKYL